MRSLPTVEREYHPDPDACTYALALLLKGNEGKVAERLTSPDDRDVVKESNEHDAETTLP
jgi:hypothetical protein